MFCLLNLSSVLLDTPILGSFTLQKNSEIQMFSIMIIILTYIFSLPGVQLTAIVLISEMCVLSPDVVTHFRRVRIFFFLVWFHERNLWKGLLPKIVFLGRF